MPAESNKSKFLERLAILMKEKNIDSRRQLGDKTGISPNTIDNWYVRDSQFPGSLHLNTLCDFFGVSMDYLCGRTDCRLDMAKSNPFAPYLKEGEMLAFHLDEGDASDLTEDEIKEVIGFIKYVKSKHKNEDN